MSTPEEWARAYARQAGADLDTWELLQEMEPVPDCHRLLFLQMSCEKLAKAHLCGSGSDPRDLQTSHAYIAKNLHLIVRQEAVESGLKSRRVALIVRHAKHLAYEIELLAPAVRRGGQRPDNCEYPWEDAAGRLHLPLDWSFTSAELAAVPAGRSFLKLVRAAIRRLL